MFPLLAPVYAGALQVVFTIFNTIDITAIYHDHTERKINQETWQGRQQVIASIKDLLASDVSPSMLTLCVLGPVCAIATCYQVWQIKRNTTSASGVQIPAPGKQASGSVAPGDINIGGQSTFVINNGGNVTFNQTDI